MHPTMRLYEDVLSSAENVEFRLPPLPRFIFVVHGSAKIAAATLGEGEAYEDVPVEGGGEVPPDETAGDPRPEPEEDYAPDEEPPPLVDAPESYERAWERRRPRARGAHRRVALQSATSPK